MAATFVPALLLTTAAFGGSPRGVVLDFSATWCGPCQQMNPIVSRLERQGYPIRQVDVDREPELAQRYGISSIPAFVLVVDGKEVTRITGATSEEQLRRLLAQIPSDPLPVASTDALPRSTGPDPRRPERAADPAGRENGAGERPTPRPLAQTSPQSEPKPARSGNLLGRLLGRKGPAEPEAAVVRGNDDAAEEPINLLPVRNPLRASVRLHVTINGQTSVGSGTAIDSRTGRTVVATCGHLFKGWNEESKIEVDVFTETGIKKFVGRMVSYDIAADVGLVTINTDNIIATAEVPDIQGRCEAGQRVVNIGCSGGAPPTQESVSVTALNYFEGPDNVECTGVPVQGRSGGGLFNEQGQLVGICIGADAQRQRGAYAGLLAIHDQLDAAGFAELYRGSVAEAPADTLADQNTRDQSVVQASEDAGASAVDQVALPVEVSSPEEPTESSQGDVEVVCIIRDRRQPNAPSRVVIIDRASPSFLSFLGGELNRTAMNGEPSTTRTNRVAPCTTFDQRRLQDLRRVFGPKVSSRPLFTSPGTSRNGERSRSDALQPTALDRPFTPQRYTRSGSSPR